MSRQSKTRRQGDLVQTPGSLTDQINQDRSVTTKKSREKQKRKLDHEEDDEQVCVISTNLDFRIG